MASGDVISNFHLPVSTSLVTFTPVNDSMITFISGQASIMNMYGISGAAYHAMSLPDGIGGTTADVLKMEGLTNTKIFITTTNTLGFQMTSGGGSVSVSGIEL